MEDPKGVPATSIQFRTFDWNGGLDGDSKIVLLRDQVSRKSALERCSGLICSNLLMGTYEYVLQDGDLTAEGVVAVHEQNQVLDVSFVPGLVHSVTIDGRILDYDKGSGPDRIRLRSLFFDREVQVRVQPGGFFRISYAPRTKAALFAFRGGTLLHFQLISTAEVRGGQCQVVIRLGARPEIRPLSQSPVE